jgi:hypothetical protein
LQLYRVREYDQGSDVERSDRSRSEFIYSVAVGLLTGDFFQDGSNSIMDRPISTCWDMGNVEESNVR